MNHNLAHLIREHRRARRLSQSELALAAGVGKTVVFDIEHGKPTVQMDTVLKILRVLDIRLAFEVPSLAPAKRPRQRALPPKPNHSEAKEETDLFPAHLL